MHSHGQQQEQACPACTASYVEKVIVEPGVRWSDLFPGTTYDFFNRHDRRCSSAINVTEDGDQERLADGEVAVYFHSHDSSPDLPSP